MSYIFDVGDTTVWSPATRIGKMYVGSAQSFATQLGCQSGLLANAEDFYLIQPEPFTGFLSSLADEQSLRQPVYASLVTGFLAVSVVLMERGEMDRFVAQGIAARLGVDPYQLATQMPR